ncbi:MAG: TetR/AcrR family transcriptional regulator [Cupriavidus necator]
MKVNRQQVAENHGKILDTAIRLFQERGFEAVTVSDVMKTAGLTHGGFYGHFKSKDDLIARSLAHVLETKAVPVVDLSAYAARYLASSHRDDLAGGCPFAALSGETIRQAPEARAAMTSGLREKIRRLSEGAPGVNAAQARRAAIGNYAAMVGAVILARLIDDPQLSDEVLEQTHLWMGTINAETAKT